MNDRLKFRYWHTKENKYIHTQCDCLAICHSCFQSIRDVPDVRGWYNTVLDEAYNDFELIPEQCTGLKDKNGNLIYEGDIIHDLGEIEPICSLPLIVRWDDRTAGFYLDHQKIGMRASLGRIDSADSHNYEIIGNIHEQAEQKE